METWLVLQLILQSVTINPTHWVNCNILTFTTFGCKQLVLYNMSKKIVSV